MRYTMRLTRSLADFAKMVELRRRAATNEAAPTSKSRPIAKTIARANSKQAKVLGMLHRAQGTTIDAIAKETN
jgi:hypothetical protein